MSSIAIPNDDAWHAIRLRNVGASESAALFGMLPWKSAWQLHMEKSGKLPAPDLDDVKHIRQGKHFEPAIAGWAREKWGITLNKVHRYLIADDCPGMGASLDYEQVGTGKRIPTEIKWVVRKGDAWEYDGDEITAAPDYYMVQVQHQIGCDEHATHGQLIAFIDGDLRRALYERRPKMIESIKANIQRFWFDVQQGNEPMIDFKADAEAVMRYGSLMPFKQIDWTDEVAKLVELAHTHGKVASEAEDICKAAKAELTNLMIDRAAKEKGNNDPTAKIVVEGWSGSEDKRTFYRVSNWYNEENEGKEITPEMVGERLYAKKAFRVCKVSTPKPPKPPKAAKKQKDAAE
jgi:putative phage-type endonuclease